jgi:hypothetical protein
MVCITNCAIGAAFIGGTIATALVSKQDTVFQEYHKTLNTQQRDALERISNHRLTLYVQGTILGIILVTLFAIYGGGKMSPLTSGCTFVAIVLLTQYFYYILMPKPDWMIRHLKNKEQNDKWLQVYRHMSLRWHLGLLVGLVGFFILGRGVAA